MRKMLLSAFLCGVLVGAPIVAQAESVTVSANVIQPEVIMTLNPSSVDFGDLLQGVKSNDQTIEISNGSATTPLNVSVTLGQYPSSYGDPINDPTKIGLYWKTVSGNSYLFEENYGPVPYVGTNSSYVLTIFMRVGTQAPVGPANLTLEFSPTPAL